MKSFTGLNLSCAVNFFIFTLVPMPLDTALVSAVQAPLKSSHRGIMNEFQENTEDAIVASIQKGIPIIDIDVMVTKAGDLVLSHDDNIKDYLPDHRDLWIKELSREQIKALDIADELTYGRFGREITHKYPKTNKFAFLDEVFDRYVDQTIFWLDIKSRAYRFSSPNHDPEILDQFLRSKLNKLDRVIISSTNPSIVIAIADLAKKNGYFDRLTIGMDYGFEESYFNRLAIDSKLYDDKYGFNFMAVGRGLVSQEAIDSRPNMKVLVYSYLPDEVPTFNNIYSYLVEYYP